MRECNRCNQRSLGGGECRGGIVGLNQVFWVSFQEVSKRFQSACNGRQKSAVKVYHAKELLELFQVAWQRKFLHG